MEIKGFNKDTLNKFLPYILILVSLVVGFYLLLERGIITLPSFGSKSNVVSVPRSSVDLLYTGEDYKLSYASFDPAKFISIAKFDKNEQWQGTGSLGEGFYKEETIISLTDRDREKAIAYLFKNLNLTGIDIIKLSVDLKTDPDDLETLNILFGDRDFNNYYRFPLTSLIAGLNYITIPKYRFSQVTNESNQKKESANIAINNSSLSWDKIERIQLELLSRPTTKAIVDVGWMRGEREGIYSPEWNWDSQAHFFNLDTTSDGKSTLFVTDVGGRGIATLRKIGSTKDFSFSVKINSFKKGPIGLFFRGDYKTGNGYYLSTGGIGTNNWYIAKFSNAGGQPKTTILMDGEIANFEFSREQSYWLKVTTKGNIITGYFSLDGQEWTKFGSITDNEFGAGGVGLSATSGAYGYFDDFNLTLR